MEMSLLEKFMSYINKEHKVAQYVKQIKDKRSRLLIRTSVVAYLLIFSFAMHVSSFNRMKYLLEDNKARFINLFPKNTKLPKIDAIRDSVKSMSINDVNEMHGAIVANAIQNGALEENTINGLKVAAVDGVELFKSKVKNCSGCLTRELKNGETEYFHRAVLCLTVGGDPHLALGAEMLKPKNDGSDKDEGELTGVKRLLPGLVQKHGKFADVIVGDSLYMNAPFLNLVASLGMASVIRAKDERLSIVKNALANCANRPPDGVFKDTKKTVEFWEVDNCRMVGCNGNIRFFKFVETWTTSKGKVKTREAWCITTLSNEIYAHTVWLIMRKRWDIENNGMRMLKTFFNADHNYVHGQEANEKILTFILIAFNLVELFLFRKLENFRKLRLLRIDILTTIYDELLIIDVSDYFVKVESG